MIRILLFILILPLIPFTVNGTASKDTVDFTTGHPAVDRPDQILKPVQIITRDEIRQSNASNLAELLKYLLNFNVVYLGRGGYDALYLGGDRKNLKVLIDGIPMFTNAHDRVDFNTIPVLNLERIEIVKGSSSALWGTDAVTMVINLITLDLRGEYTKGMVGLRASVPGYSDAMGKFQINTARHRINMFGSRSYFNGFQGIDSGRVMQWKPLVNYNFNTSYSYTIMRGIEAFVRLDHTYQKVLDQSYPIPNTTRAIDQELNITRGVYVAGIRGQLSKYHYFRIDQSLTTYIQRDVRFMKELTDLEREREPIENPTDSLNYRQYRTSMLLAKKPEKLLGYVTGMEFTHQEDKVVGIREAIKSTITEMSFFGGMQMKPDKRTDLDLMLRLAGSSKFRIPPTFDGNFRYRMTDDAFVYLSYSRSYRTPSWNELFYIYDRPDVNIQGNLNLRAEATNTFFGRFDIIGDHISFKFSLFFLNTKNGIELVLKDKENNAYKFVNTRLFKSIGNIVEVDGNFQNLKFNFGISNTGVNRFPDRVGNYNFTIETIANIRQTIPNTNLEIWMFNKFVSSRADLIENEDGTLEEQQFDGYAYSDIGIAYKFKQNGVLLSFGMKNMFDTQNTAGLYLPVERLNDQQINRRVPIALDYGRRLWVSMVYEI